MELKIRDREVLASVNACRLLSQSQIQRLHFPSKNTAQVRLQKLWQHCYLKRIFTEGAVTSEMLYTLDSRGAELLQLEHHLPRETIRIYRGKTINPIALAHTLAIADVRIAVTLAAKCNGYQITTWLDDLDTKADYDRIQIERHLVPIVPDSYFVINTKQGQFRFLLEYDSGTEGLKTIERKMLAYQVYIEGGKCERRYKTDKVRILFVSHSKTKRLEHMRELATSLRTAVYFWFAPLATFTGDVLSNPIWIHGDNPHLRSLIPPQLVQ